MLGEIDVHRRDEDLAEPARADERRDAERGVEHDALVLEDGCRAHDVLAVDDLVTQEVVRELAQVPAASVEAVEDRVGRRDVSTLEQLEARHLPAIEGDDFAVEQKRALPQASDRGRGG